jgi:uncharacterized protein (TIGR03067 family)
MRIIAGLALLLAGVAGAADGPADEIKKEQEKFKGAWAFASAVIEGKAEPEDNLKGLQVLFDGDKFELREANRVLATYTYTLDLAQKPATIDTTLTSGPDKGKVEKGIYKFEGETLVLCFGHGDKAPRPKTFESKEGGKAELTVLKRAK